MKGWFKARTPYGYSSISRFKTQSADAEGGTQNNSFLDTRSADGACLKIIVKHIRPMPSFELTVMIYI